MQSNQNEKSSTPAATIMCNVQYKIRTQTNKLYV